MKIKSLLIAVLWLAGAGWCAAREASALLQEEVLLRSVSHQVETAQEREQKILRNFDPLNKGFAEGEVLTLPIQPLREKEVSLPREKTVHWKIPVCALRRCLAAAPDGDFSAGDAGQILIHTQKNVSSMQWDYVERVWISVKGAEDFPVYMIEYWPGWTNLDGPEAEAAFEGYFCPFADKDQRSALTRDMDPQTDLPSFILLEKNPRAPGGC